MGLRLSHYMQASMELSTDNVTPTFHVDTDESVAPETTLAIDILDRTERQVFVKTDQQQGLRHSYTGMLCIDVLQNNLLQFTMTHTKNTNDEWVSPTATEYLAAIADVLDMNYALRGTDFTPASDAKVEKVGSTETKKETISGRLNDILNRLFGWSADVPKMQYIAHIDGNTLRVTQRGHEVSSVTIDSNIVGLPTLTREIRHTEWDNGTTGDKNIYCGDNDEVNEPFSGTIEWQGHVITYEDGYVTREVVTTNPLEDAETITTTYTYDDGYVVEKVITDDTTGTVTTVTYSYETTDNNKFLAREETEVTESGSSVPVSSTLKLCTPIGNGYFAYDVYDTTDGGRELISTSLGQGAPGGKTSQYMVNKANEAIKVGEQASEDGRLKVAIDGVAKAKSVYPVRDYSTLERIASSLDATEGQTEETLSAEIVGINNVIDFDYTIRYGGNTYYLMSNNVTITPNSRRQNIVCKRWY